MNSYIIRPLAQIKKKLSSKETLSPDTIDSIIGELEMIKLNIEQHKPQEADNVTCALTFTGTLNYVEQQSTKLGEITVTLNTVTP